MKAAAKRRWVDKLRSGDYTQGTMRLRDNLDRYCCLGVLCDLDKRGKWEDGQSWRYTYPGSQDETAIIPRSLLARVGLTRAEESRLAWMNDRGSTFEDIAGYIEEYI